jgi:two-component system chemotaxis response regulator CheY
MPFNIMIVDDSPAIRKILHRVLAHADMTVDEVLEAKDGHEALEKLQGMTVALILSDINMPGMDGIELLRHVKSDERLKDVPVVMITTEGGETRVKEAADLGAAGYIRKPFAAAQINETLAEIF